ncbi:MAG: hypothetical protein ACKO86_24870, partial [Dolichospermum sp.]
YLVRTRRRQPLATKPEKQALTGDIVLGLKYVWFLLPIPYLWTERIFGKDGVENNQEVADYEKYQHKE